ncbi:MAG TPA: HAMP domain-containing sensor histidine kinase [Bacteroidales bacterium]
MEVTSHFKAEVARHEIELNLEETMESLKSNLLNCPTILKGISHEMRTHMNAIVAFSFLMKENCKSISEGEEFSNQILSSCEQLIELFDSFLDSAIIETGNSKVDLKVCKFDNILDELISEFREEIRSEGKKDIELITEIQFHNSLEVLIDQSKVFRIIRCLFQNSMKNTASGYIRIGYNSENGNVTFYILDSGQGYFKFREFINTTDLNELLKVHNDTYTAINITLAKNLIQILGGTIRIECNGLTGSGIYFTIPAKEISNNNFNLTNYVKAMIAI